MEFHVFQFCCMLYVHSFDSISEIVSVNMLACRQNLGGYEGLSVLVMVFVILVKVIVSHDVSVSGNV